MNNALSTDCCGNVATTAYAVVERSYEDRLIDSMHPLIPLLSVNADVNQAVMRSSVAGNICTLVTKNFEVPNLKREPACGAICNAPVNESIFDTLNCLFTKQKLYLIRLEERVSVNFCQLVEFSVQMKDIFEMFWRSLTANLSGYLMNDYMRDLEGLGCNCDTMTTGTTRLVDWMRLPIIDLVNKGKTSSAAPATDVPKDYQWSQNTANVILSAFTSNMMANGLTVGSKDVFLAVPDTIFASFQRSTVAFINNPIPGVARGWTTMMQSGLHVLKFPLEAFYINEDNRLIMPMFVRGGFGYYTSRVMRPSFLNDYGVALSTPMEIMGNLFSILAYMAHGNLRYGGNTAELVMYLLAGGIKLDQYKLGLVLGPVVDPSLFRELKRYNTKNAPRIQIVQNDDMCISVCPTTP